MIAIRVLLILMTRLCGLGSQLKVLGSLEAQLLLGLTFLAFQSENDFTGGLCLFVKHRLCLSTKSHLLGIVTTLSLSKVGRLTRFVLRHLVHFMLLALASTVGLAFFRNVYHGILIDCLITDYLSMVPVPIYNKDKSDERSKNTVTRRLQRPSIVKNYCYSNIIQLAMVDLLDQLLDQQG